MQIINGLLLSVMVGVIIVMIRVATLNKRSMIVKFGNDLRMEFVVVLFLIDCVLNFLYHIINN